MEKILPILSGSLREVIEAVATKYDCQIAKDLLSANDFVQAYNKAIDTGYDEFINITSYLKNNIDDLCTDAVRMLSFRSGSFEISFLPEGREPKYTNTGNWSKENRQVGKPTRIIQKLLKREYKTRDLELFNNYLRAEIQGAFNFEIVSGSDITKYYNVETYFREAGTLGNSCMRHSRCADYFKVYEDCAKMLITKKNDKITGRALLWEIDGKTYMDRIYTCFDYLENNFIEHAEQNHWYHRANNSLLHSGNDQMWVGTEDNYTSEHAYDLTIHLNKKYAYMPYLDSFRYYDYEKDCLYSIKKYHTVALDSTDGAISDEDIRIITCSICGRTEICYDGDEPEDMIYSEFTHGYVCTDHCWIATGLSADEDAPFYVPNTIEATTVHCKDGDKTFPKDFVENVAWVEMDKQAAPQDYGFIELNGEWWDLHHARVIFDEVYKLKDIEDGDTTRSDSSTGA